MNQHGITREAKKELDASMKDQLAPEIIQQKQERYERELEKSYAYAAATNAADEDNQRARRGAPGPGK